MGSQRVRHDLATEHSGTLPLKCLSVLERSSNTLSRMDPLLALMESGLQMRKEVWKGSETHLVDSTVHHSGISFY